jgi:hypothetical protein
MANSRASDKDHQAWRGREGWLERLGAALAAGGCTSQTEWLSKFPGTHCWFVFDLDRGWESCAACGTVRRADDSNKPCKGIVTVEPRGFYR